MTDEQIASIVHDANAAYCVTLGDNSQPPWRYAPGWQRDSAIEGVRKTRSGEITTPEESHKSWLAQKEADGWVFGDVKDPDKKEHPCMVPYDQLPPEQRIKDALFQAIVGALLQGESVAV